MARSCPALNPRRGGNQLLAEFVILTFEIADLLAQHDAPVARFQILSIERLGQRAHGIRQRTIMDSKYVASLIISTYRQAKLPRSIFCNK